MSQEHRALVDQMIEQTKELETLRETNRILEERLEKIFEYVRVIKESSHTPFSV